MGSKTEYSAAAVASTKSKRARKRRNPGAAPRAVPSDRRQTRATRSAQAAEQRRRASRQLGREGERPLGPFGAVPVSEVAILGGLVAAVVGFVGQTELTLIVGLIICALGVIEVTGREHLSGYRSHTALLAAIPAVGIEAGIVALFGDPRQRGFLLLAVIPVFALLFWALRHRFAIARQARVARAARGTAPASNVSPKNG